MEKQKYFVLNWAGIIAEIGEYTNSEDAAKAAKALCGDDFVLWVADEFTAAGWLFVLNDAIGKKYLGGK
jgi:hypothetical protein